MDHVSHQVIAPVAQDTMVVNVKIMIVLESYIPTALYAQRMANAHPLINAHVTVDLLVLNVKTMVVLV